MKIRISIVREYDTEEDSLEGIDPIPYFLNCFSDDIDNLVKYNEVKESARVETEVNA
jgi:hypothetical protein